MKLPRRSFLHLAAGAAALPVAARIASADTYPSRRGYRQMGQGGQVLGRDAGVILWSQFQHSKASRCDNRA
jgi:hypothetical protein